MFEQNPLLSIIMILLIAILLISILREIYSFYLLVKGPDEEPEEEEPSEVDRTIPAPQEFLQEQRNYILDRILDELDAGNNTFIPSFPERLHRDTLLLTLAEVEAKGYVVTTETNREGHISRVTFTPQLRH